MKAQEILKRIEERKGRKLDLSKHSDKASLFMTINREFEELNGRLSMINQLLNSKNICIYRTDEQKTIYLSGRDKGLS